MFKIAICDDEQIQRSMLREQINYYSIQKSIDFEIKEFSSGRLLLQSNFHFDLLFLDIYLKDDYNGLDYAKKLRDMGNTSFIVFFTSLNESNFIRAGYTVGAFRYLVKPIDQFDINSLMDDFICKISNHSDKISITANKCDYFININDIIFIESISRKRSIYVADYKIETWETLSSLYNRLPQDIFLYPHKCFVVNINHVENLTNNQILMSTGTTITLGRRYYKDFRSKLYNLIQKNP